MAGKGQVHISSFLLLKTQEIGCINQHSGSSLEMFKSRLDMAQGTSSEQPCSSRGGTRWT